MRADCAYASPHISAVTAPSGSSAGARIVRATTSAATTSAPPAIAAPSIVLRAERAAQQQAAEQLRAAQARLEDLKKGSRPSELATLEARREQASAAASAADASQAAGDQQKDDQQRNLVSELRSQATECRRQAAELSRAAVNRQKASFALNAGNQLLLRGQIADAVARYQESIAADATFAEAHSQLAVAFERQGRADNAATERAKAKDLAPAR